MRYSLFRVIHFLIKHEFLLSKYEKILNLLCNILNLRGKILLEEQSYNVAKVNKIAHHV